MSYKSDEVFLTKKSDKILNDLSLLAKSFSLRGSSIKEGVCYITGNTYPPDDPFYLSLICGSYSGFPYNNINYHSENKWMVEALQTLFIVYNNVIPHSMDNIYHNLPIIIKIPRSNKDPHDAMLVNPNYGIRIRDNKHNLEGGKLIYVRVNWFDDVTTPELTREQVVKYGMNTDLTSHKDILLSDIYNYNPGIKKLVVTIPKLVITSDMETTQREVYEYCNKKLDAWYKNTLSPLIELYNY